MRYNIQFIKEKYYVFMTDEYGNKYDTMRSFKTLAAARKWVEDV